MTINNVLLIVTAFAGVLESIAVAATLIYVIRQTTMTRRSIEELEKESRLDFLSSMSAHVKDINMAMLQDNELRELFGYDKEDVLAFMLIDNLEMRYLLRKCGLVEEPMWKVDETVISRTMQRDFVQPIWSRFKDEYHVDFVRFVGQIISDAAPDSSTDSATHVKENTVAESG